MYTSLLSTDYHMVINLSHEGLVIGTKEMKGVSGANTPFLFDLPPGDVTTLPLMMEFIVMQVGGVTFLCFSYDV